MAWTYTGNPADSDRDAVRFLIQDTEQATPLVQDEEIAFALDQEGSATSAAALCLETLARRFGRMADTQLTSGVDSVRETYSTMAAGFAALARELRAQASGGTGSPWHGGGSQSRKDTIADTPDLVQSTFRRGQFDLPGGR